MLSKCLPLVVGLLATSSFAFAAPPVELPKGFPQGEYTPFGYIDNPAHSSVINRSGIIRSVPPLGYGFWARRMPWPYGEGALRSVNYLSFLKLAVNVDGEHLASSADFERLGVKLVSRYHTKTMMSYDWTYAGLNFSARYFLANPDAMVCMLDIRNPGGAAREVTLHATNVYGFPERRWWGSDGAATQFEKTPDAAVSKIWAYGDNFALGADRQAAAQKATPSREEWQHWLEANDLSSNKGATAKFPWPQEDEDSEPQNANDPWATYAVQSYLLAVPANGETSLVVALSRGVNERSTLANLEASLQSSAQDLKVQLATDEAFYATAPVLTGDWPADWQHGWIYDLETLRMTFRPPVGIYKHHWDGMQIFTPRNVLGEASLDAMAMSFADIDLAKDSLLGTFANALAPNVPCSREDGSVNMICADGSEVGTAPIWGMPFHVIRSIYVRDNDRAWIKALYPHLKSYLQWWIANRTDQDGWFHAKCSWEAGQDGSKRFLVDSHDPGAVADFVRTVDIESAMAEAFQNMALFAEVAGYSDDIPYWRNLADHRLKTTRAMFVDGWFRDFDSRTGKPIILNEYYDVMMMFPIAAGIATPEQVAGMHSRFQHFADNPVFWLEWPSFMQVFTEAVWNAGQREFLGDIVVRTCERVYPRLDARGTKTIAPFKTDMPAEYAFRMPGVSNEFWPIYDDNPGGTENYGWGATLPALVIRNVIGFREFDDPSLQQFRLAPAFPERMLTVGNRYGITNLGFQGSKSDVVYQISSDQNKLDVQLTTWRSGLKALDIKDANGKLIASHDATDGKVEINFSAENGQSYTVCLR
jgi:hypothetical protein